MKISALVFCFFSFLSVSMAARALDDGTRRIAVVAAASDGGAHRAHLRYAVADAELIASTLVEVGGTAADDVSLLLDFDLAEIDDALGKLPERVAKARMTSPRVEVVFYYSGHSSELGLNLGEATYPWSALRGRLKETGADLVVVLVDSCASGNLTRDKGGRVVPAALTASDVTGLVIMTSASASEAAQESALLGGSFFTHSLVTGLRGAGDVDDDGIVTIGEAYDYAYHATLEATEATSAGPQHAVHELDLKGRGDVAFSDVRARSAGLILTAAVDGRVAVYNERGRNVVELMKRAGVTSTLALEPGSYVAYVDTKRGVRVAHFTLAAQKTQTSDALHFVDVADVASVARGVAPSLSPRGRVLAEKAYDDAAIRVRDQGFTRVVIRGAAEAPLYGSSLYTVVARTDLFEDMQARESCQGTLFTTATTLVGVGGAACIGGIAIVAADPHRSAAGAKPSLYENIAGFSELGGLCAMGIGAGTGIAAALVPVDPLSAPDKDALIASYNSKLRADLGLPPLSTSTSPSASTPSSSTGAMLH